MHAHSMSRTSQILHDDQTRCGENFAESITNADARTICDSSPSCITASSEAKEIESVAIEKIWENFPQVSLTIKSS